MIKQVLIAVNTRITRLSSNKKIFHESSKMYIEVLKKSGFKEFTYLEPKRIKPNNNLYKNKETTDNCNIKVKCYKNRKRKII